MQNRSNSKEGEGREALDVNKHQATSWTLYILVFSIAVPPFFPNFQFGYDVTFVDLWFPVMLSAILINFNKNMNLEYFCIFVFHCLFFVSILNISGSFEEPLLKVVRAIFVVFPFFLAFSVPRWRSEDFHLLIKAFLIGGGVGIWLGIVGFVFQIPGLVASQTYPFPFIGTYYRAGGVFENSGPFGFLVGVWAVLYVCLLRFTKSTSILHWTFLIITMTLGLLMSASRTTIVMLILGFVIASEVSGRRSYLFYVLSVLFFMIILLFTPIGDVIIERAITTFDQIFSNDYYYYDTAFRLETWKYLLTSFFNSNLSILLFGIGHKMLGNDGTYGRFDLVADSQYISLLLQNGFVGFFVFFVFLVYLFRKLFVMVKKGALEASLVLALWVCVVVGAAFGDVLTYYGILPGIWAVTGAWLASHPSQS